MGTDLGSWRAARGHRFQGYGSSLGSGVQENKEKRMFLLPSSLQWN